MSSLKVVVVGVGHLGQHHARIASGHSEVNLVAVVDPDKSRGQEIARQYQTAWAADLTSVSVPFDAVQVAAPTAHHEILGRQILNLGKHLLMEKPLTATIGQAENLLEVYAKAKEKIPTLVAAVGHLERFNPVVKAFQERNFKPRFLEAIRVSPFPMRSLEVDVVLDVMIHDLDLILALVGRPVIDVEAIGIPVLTPQADLVNARIKFDGGAYALVTASRVAQKKERTLRAFGDKSYAKLDFSSQKMEILNLVQGKNGFEIKNEQIEITEGEPLQIELDHFYKACLGYPNDIVGWDEGLRAMRVADRVQRAVALSLSEMR